MRRNWVSSPNRPQPARPRKTASTNKPRTEALMAQIFSELANFLWSVADLLRGDLRQADYGKVILPLAQRC